MNEDLVEVVLLVEFPKGKLLIQIEKGVVPCLKQAFVWPSDQQASVEVWTYSCFIYVSLHWEYSVLRYVAVMVDEGPEFVDGLVVA